MVTRSLRLIAGLAGGIAVMLALLSSLPSVHALAHTGPQPLRQAAVARFVNPDGHDAGDCTLITAPCRP